MPEGVDRYLYQHCGAVLGPGHAEVRGYELADKIARDGFVQSFVVHEPSLGESRQNIR